MTKYVVPMYESERGWGAKIDGYAGPFDTREDADAFRAAYNAKNNNLDHAPDWYIAALAPVEFSHQDCCYKSTVD
jgi:hypothetical protein